MLGWVGIICRCQFSSLSVSAADCLACACLSLLVRPGRGWLLTTNQLTNCLRDLRHHQQLLYYCTYLPLSTPYLHPHPHDLTD
ncbi:hypothetical protein BO71DRAFT_204561 [Aspergillus ellipticus CBS 707.79]|uniref:Secreted protein n=1 Tax=Aspergillus ellipticus CBS 707.79 TaxID=1448320 RepID=A0A319DVK4_9EURO|nr:hypothetical protein BO71DRAFT_204561 [Aspergillus ellipticus CBS 707.79]